jgi:leucyl-tRNA synthetase
MKEYNHKKIEKKRQSYWKKKGIYKTKEVVGQKKSYVLDMFPYPSGDGLHVGHPKGYIATDIYSRMKKMQGFNVLHPMGWDAFGLPAENYAIKNKIHPRKAVEKNIKRFKEQLEIIGFNYDWSREINTTDPGYYKWTQWIFLQLYKKGLAFQSFEPINWCPSCQTGLANEDLENGRCERCGSVVEKRPMRQWTLKITEYADRLLKDLDELNWPEYIKESQRNWIGRSEGAEFEFELNFTHKPEANKNRGPNGEKAAIKVFTTRPDTLFGATYLVLSPEHLWVTLATDAKHDVLENKSEVKKYLEATKKKTEIERTTADKVKTGVELKGVKAINPATGEEIPVFVADYVLANYGTGAIMAVPAHDERDFDFAKKYNLPVKTVIRPAFGLEHKKEGAVHRETISAIIKRKDGKYLVLKFGAHNWVTPPIGGIDKGETPAQAAEREVLEETGFHAKHVITSDIAIESHFYADHKKEWRSRLDFPVLLELDESKSQEEISDEDKGRYEYMWLTPEEAIKQVTFGNNKLAYEVFINKIKIFNEGVRAEKSVVVNSGKFDGLMSEEAKEKITEKFGKKTVTYKLRDWVFSRQRYWGEPIPIIHCEKCGIVPVPEKDLPVKLPEVKHYEPTGTGESPLAAISKWVNVKCPVCKSPAKRETNTMPQWAGSSWYYIRYEDPKNKKALVDKQKEKYWSPIDMYVGGAEHATRHLIYARFWHKFLYDIDVVNYKEPFTRLQNVGLILAEDGRKMSKRYGNVVNPDDVVNQFGADTLRIYEMFMGPFNQSVAWSTNSIVGSRRFIERVWKLQSKVVPKAPFDASLESLIHKTIKKVSADIESFAFNTGVSSLMILLNAFEKKEQVAKSYYGHFIKLLAPFAPHITDEIWQGSLGNKGSVHIAPWDTANEAKIKADVATIVVQVNGKVRGEFEAEQAIGKDEAETKAKALPDVIKWISGKGIKKVIFVPGKLINFVIE